HPASAVVDRLWAGPGYLREFLFRSLWTGSSISPVRGRGAAVRQDTDSLQGLARAPGDAAASRLFSARALRMVRRERGDVHQNVGISAPARRLVAGAVREARLLVPAPHHQLCTSGACEPAARAGAKGQA